MSFDMTQIIARKYHPGLREFAANETLELYKVDIDFSLRYKLKATVTEDDNLMYLLSKARELKGGTHDYIAMDAIGSMLIDGPKVFQPTKRQCEAMSQVSLDIPYSLYQQPFPTFCIQYPRDSGLTIGGEPVNFAILKHRPDLCVSISLFSGKNSIIGCFIIDRGPDAEMEQCINRGNDITGESLETSKKCDRIAINCALMLTHYRIKTRPLRPKEFHKTLRFSKSHDKDESERGKLLHQGEFQVVEFEQEVSFYEEINESSHESGHYTGEIMPPHWRRGHWRREMGYRKIIDAGLVPRRVFIRPVLVNQRRFAGDMGNTTAIYKG